MSIICYIIYLLSGSDFRDDLPIQWLSVPFLTALMRLFGPILSGPIFRTRLIRSSPAILKSSRFPLFHCYLISTRFGTLLLEDFSNSPVGPFVESDDHIVLIVVNRNGNVCRQKSTSSLASLASLVSNHFSHLRWEWVRTVWRRIAFIIVT